MDNLVKVWSQTLDTYNQDMFNGTDPSKTEFYDAIIKGKVLKPGLQEDELDAQNAIERALMGS